MWGFQGSCSRVLMCLAGWDCLVENWMVGALQYTNTFKSLDRRRQTSHLWGRFARDVLLGSVGPTVCAGGWSRYVRKIDSCTITEITGACTVPS